MASNLNDGRQVTDSVGVQQDLNNARSDQQNLELIGKVQADILAAMEKLQALASEHHEVALLWDTNKDAQMAQKARALEQQALSLLDRLAKLDSTSESESQTLLTEIKHYLSHSPNR